MYKRKQFVAPVIKTGVIAAATVFTAFALLGGGGTSAAESDRAAVQQPTGEATGVRVTVKNPRMGTPVRVMNEFKNVVAMEPGEVVDEVPALGRPASKPSGDGNNNHGGVAGSACPGEGDCLTAHATPGCDDQECCEAVCATDEFCCVFAWEQGCVDIAAALPECQVCPVFEHQCVEHITPGAIYSNWHPDCFTGAFIHGENLRADDLWYGESGGTLQELTYSVFNSATNETLLNVELEIIISSTMPGGVYGAGGGTLDLSTALVIFEVELDTDALNGGLEPGTAAMFTLDDLAQFNVVLPVPMVYAGIRYTGATFKDDIGEIAQLGQALINMPALGRSTNSLFCHNFSATCFFGVDGPVANAAWELVTDGDVGPTRILFDNAPQQEVISDGNQSNFGWSVGQLSAASPHIRHAQAFTLPDGADAWRITGIFPHGFVPATAMPNLQTLNWAIWERDGVDDPPVAGEEIASGSLPYPATLHLSHGKHSLGGRVHPIPVDLVLPPGEYYLTVHGSGAPDVFPSHWAWLMNAGNAIKMVDANGPYMWHTANYDTTPFGKATSTVEPDPCQPDPETRWYTVFYILGEEDDKDPGVPCPGDLTGSGSVGVADLLALLACWGPVAPGCENADLTGSGSVGVADLLALLAQWGPCP